MRLNQVLAVERGVKGKVNSDVDAIYKQAQKPALFDGFRKTYKKKDENDPDDAPPQKQNVQMSAKTALDTVSARLTELFDIVAQKEFANTLGKASVVVDGVTLIKDAPVGLLMFLSKQLTDLLTMITTFPVLDPAEVWSYDENSGLHRTEVTETTRTKKVQKSLVLLQPTKEHPGQAQMITEDAGVGTWEMVKFSGAMPEPRRRELALRVERLLAAVKVAREEANMIEAPPQNVGKPLFEWILR